MTEPKKSDISLHIDTSNDNNKETTEITEKTIKIDDVTENDERVTIIDENNESNNDEKKNVDFSKNLQVGGQNVLVVKNENDVVSGNSAPKCCIAGSPEHVAVLKAKVDELKELKVNITKAQEERARIEEETQNRVTKELDKLASELKELGHGDADSEQSIHATVHTFGKLRKLEIIADEEDDFDFDRLWRIPKIRQYWHVDTLHREAGERKTSYTELFLDLILSAVVQNIGHLLAADISFGNVQRFIITFYPIYRVWSDVHNYLNVYSSRDIFEKVLILWQLCLVIIMGTHTSNIFESTNAIYLASYVIARFTFVSYYFFLAICLPLFRISLIRNAWGIFIPCVLWIISIFVPSENKVPLMWSAILFDMLWIISVPIYNRYGAKRQAKSNLGLEKTNTSVSLYSLGTPIIPNKAMRTRGTEFEWKWTEIFTFFKIAEYRPAINIEHWSERYGVFAIICLGEAIFGMVYSSLNPNLDWQLGKAILSLLIAYNLHWIYFDVDASRQYLHALRRHVVTGVLFGFIHLPLNMSLIAFGSSLRILMQVRDFPGAESVPLLDAYGEGGHEKAKRDVSASADSLPESLRWLFCVSLAISIYCMAVIGMLHKGLDGINCSRVQKRHRISVRLLVATIIILLPLSELSSLNLVIITAMLTLFVVSVETYGRLRRDQPLFGKCDEDIIDSKHRRYVRWIWGLNQKNLTGNILRKRKKINAEVEEKINDGDDIVNNDIVEEEINIGITKGDNKDEYKDQSCHIPCTN